MKENVIQPFKWQYFALGLFLTFLLCFQAFNIQSSLVLNADVSFLSQVALYAEKRDFYTQFYEVNPPLIVYIYKLFIYIGHWFDINNISALRLGMVSYIYICSSLILYNLSSLKYGLIVSLTLTFCLLFTLPNDFLQREHIITASLFSYFSTIVIILMGITPSLKVRIATVLMTAVAISLKPQYAIVFLTSELYLCYKFKSINNLFRIDNIIILILGFCYVTYSYLIHKNYFSTVIPLASTSYSSYFVEFKHLIVLPLTLILVSFIPLIYIYINKSKSNLSSTIVYLVLIYIASIITFLIGRTGFSYHLLLGANLGLFFIFLFLYFSIQRLWEDRKPKEVLYFILAIASLVYLHSINFYKISYRGDITINHSNVINLNQAIIEDEKYQNISPLFKTIDLNTSPKDKVFALTTTLYPINSIARHTQLQWVNKFPAMWSLPNHINNESPESQDIINFVIDSIKYDITENSPEIIIIETTDQLKRLPDGFSFLDFVSKNLEISEILEKYTVIDTVEINKYRHMEFTIYKRNLDE